MTGRGNFIEFLWIWNLDWDWNWNGSWNDLRECQKLWGGLCVLQYSYGGGLRALYKYGAKYTSLPRVFDTPSSHSNFNSNPNLNSKFTKCNEFYPAYHLPYGPYLSLKSIVIRHSWWLIDRTIDRTIDPFMVQLFNRSIVNSLGEAAPWLVNSINLSTDNSIDQSM